MARNRKQTADYFPHSVSHGKTLFIIESKYGVGGYAFWFKLLELLCSTAGHSFACVSEEETAFLVAKTGFQDTGKAFQVLDTLASLGAIDKELWKVKIIWCQGLVDNLASMYKKRTEAATPVKPQCGTGNRISANINPQKVTRNPQSKVKETKLKESKGEESNNGFQSYINDLQTNRYPQLKVGELWEDCRAWYEDHNKSMKDAKRALNNWCKREKNIHPNKSLPTAKELKEGWE